MRAQEQDFPDALRANSPVIFVVYRMVIPQNNESCRPWHTVSHKRDESYQRMSALAKEGVWRISDVSFEGVRHGGALILPFLSEPQSAHGVAKSWANLIREEFESLTDQFLIFPISAASCQETEGELRKSGFTVYAQDQVLKAIRWNDLVFDGIIPDSALSPNELPKGRKGRTMLAGTLLALRKNAPWVMFHDSDVTNPNEYGALEAIIRFLGSDNGLNACMMALVGPERHNEQWTAHCNIVALSRMYDLSVRNLATRLARLIWPLSGERGFSANWLRKLPFALGMGIETILDVACCEKELADNHNYIQQIVGSISKEERGSCDVRRENALITSCTLFLARLLEFLNSDNKSGPLWGLSLVGAAELNAHYTGTEVNIFVQQGTPGAQSIERIRRETVLPCIDALDSGNYIDWAVIDAMFDQGK